MSTLLAAAGWAETPHSMDGFVVMFNVVLIVLNLMFFSSAIGIWWVMYRSTLRRRQFTLRALLLLMTLLMLPMPFFAFTAPVMYHYTLYTIGLLFQ